MAFLGFALVIILVGCWLLLGLVLPLTRRAEEDCCPACMHPTQGLLNPVCPECGATFEDGIQGGGELTEYWRRWLGVNLITGGTILGLILLTCCVGGSVLQIMVSGARGVVEPILFLLLLVAIPLAIMIASIRVGLRVLRKSSLKPFVSADAPEATEVTEPAASSESIEPEAG